MLVVYFPGILLKFIIQMFWNSLGVIQNFPNHYNHITNSSRNLLGKTYLAWEVKTYFTANEKISKLNFIRKNIDAEPIILFIL